MLGIPPENLKPEDISTIPNPPTERTATGLLQLLHGTAHAMSIPVGQLNQVRGAICKDGVAGVFARLTHEATNEVQEWITSYYNAADETGAVKYVAFERPSGARELFNVLEQRLNA
jgi:hypothetical protein